MTTSKRIGIIGAGAIGFNVSQELARKGFDVLLYNRYHTEMDGKPSKLWIEKEGKVDDLNDALERPIHLTHSLSDLKGAYAMVITAGATRKEGETRADLARKNAAIIKAYANIIAQSPETLVMVVSNPVDGLTRYLIDLVAELTQKDPIELGKKIIGVSYVDTTRLRNLTREFLARNYPEIKRPAITGLVLGEHGPTMVPLISHTSVNGTLLSELASPEQIAQIVKGVVTRGNDIIIRTGTSAVAGPAIAVINMIMAMETERNVSFPASVFDGKVCIGRLVEFEGNTVKRIVDAPMTELEKAKLQASEQTLDAQYKEILTLPVQPSAPPQPAAVIPAPEEKTLPKLSEEQATSYLSSLQRLLEEVKKRDSSKTNIPLNTSL